MVKVKVIEVEATKLDPNAVYLIVFNEYDFTLDAARRIAKQIDGLGIKIVGAMARDPKTALKVYQIPKPESEAA